MENSQTTTPHTTSSVAVPQPSTLEGHHHNILVEDHHRGSSGGRTFLKSTTAATSSSSPSSNPSSNINNNSGSNNNNNNTNSSSSVTTPSTRRTRHRVDAGEPRGCFNNYYSPRNIFQNSSPISSSNSHSNNNNNNNIPGSIQANSNNLSNSLVVGNSITGAADYYFQPMKMLSDFIGNSHSHFNNHNSTTAASQLLLREMLQKKKIGYEDDVSEIREREREIQSSEESIGCSSGVTNNNNNNNNLTNNNDEIKINGCKNKRKLYQPQKSEFDDDQEEYKDLDDDIDMEYKNNHSADEDDEIMLKSPMAPLTRQLLTCERKQIPRSILQSWKENFKSTLMTHINELVDSQFNVLFGSIGNNSLPHSQNNSQPPHHPQPQHNSQTQQQQQQQQLQHLHHHHHSNPHPPTSRQQSITPPPSTGSAGSVPTGSQDMMGASAKTHLFNGGGSILLTENEKLRMRFQSGYRPQTGYSQALAGLAANNNRDVYEDDGPLSLVVTPKKKRHKVTDTRLTPRAVSRLLGNGSSASDHYLESTPSPRPQMPSPPVAVPISLPTSVAIPNPSLTESRHLFAPYAPLFGPVRSSLDSPPTMLPHHAMMNPVDYVQQLREISAAQQQAQREHQREQAQQATIMKRERGGGSPGSPDSGDTTGESFDLLPGVVYGPGHSSSTLTPMHLRKAKLMFFWVRYPSSAVLKMYFPDIKFNKNNTAQLVKWFSNFREFYYIQMEKYARQALSEGIKIAEDIHVSTDNELYRVLNLHYNRNNHIEVPTNFRFVVEQTLREFFKAIQSGKDSEQSWKKAIYKIIARLDDPVPEYFKSPNFLEQLE